MLLIFTLRLLIYVVALLAGLIADQVLWIIQKGITAFKGNQLYEFETSESNQ